MVPGFLFSCCVLPTVGRAELCNRQDTIELMGLKVPELGHKTPWLALSSITCSGEASCHVMRTLKQPVERTA